MNDPRVNPEEILREVIADEIIDALARASREHNVGISLTITPLDDEDGEGD